VARKYELKRRAARQEETRQRIIEAAVSLHTTVGPARTTVSAIAERAGVQRHTFYRHFPDERSLVFACSGLFQERQPLPDAEPLKAIEDPEARLRTGLTALYEYFERNAKALAPIVRDAEIHPLTREVMSLRFGESAERLRDVLVDAFDDGESPRRRRLAVLGMFLEFSAWRALRSGVGSSAEAVDAAVRAIRS
jgi:AcrR family transcriptional regulator